MAQSDQSQYHQEQYQRALELIEKDRGSAGQKSEDWLANRLDYTTASDASSPFGLNPFKTRHQFVLEKSRRKVEHFTSSVTYHGDKYEPITDRVYEELYELENPGIICRIVHLNLITTHEYGTPIAMSSDGLAFILGDIHMVEYKAPKFRVPFDPESPNYQEYDSPEEIKERGFGTLGVKVNYWIQMQTQMAVAHIDQVVFFDTQYRESVYDEEPQIPGLVMSKAVTQEPLRYRDGRLIFNGYILEPCNRPEAENRVRYPRDGEGRIIIDPERSLRWCLDEATDHENIIYWELVHYYKVRVPRDREWFNRGLEVIAECWREVESHRAAGTLPEKPEREPRVTKAQTQMLDVRVNALVREMLRAWKESPLPDLPECFIKEKKPRARKEGLIRPAARTQSRLRKV